MLGSGAAQAGSPPTSPAASHFIIGGARHSVRAVCNRSKSRGFSDEPDRGEHGVTRPTCMYVR
jgi:hypothetical protein